MKDLSEYRALNKAILYREFKEKYSASIEEYAEESGILTSLLYERVFDFLVENGVAE